ncbi:MAG: hypothetical protein NC124_18245 [Clostridium sp.]|nr:hypothetical protein [Clostridium sp.]MCM1564191.1 hypothetical protein [Clostridium sp.]
MPRIYSNYSNNDFNIVADLAKELGFSLSAFQHYCVMLYADHRGNTSPITLLIQKMFQNLNNFKSGDTFIVSALLPSDWAFLSRNDKMTLAKQLSLHVRNNSNKYGVYKKAAGKTNIYKVI